MNKLLVVLHLMQARRRAIDPARQQRTAPLSAIPPPFANTRARDHQRDMKRIRQQQRRLELPVPQLGTRIPPRRDVTVWLRGFEGDDLVHVAHHPEERRD